MISLLRERVVQVSNSDNCLGPMRERHAQILRDFVNNGLHVRAITLLHYSSKHFEAFHSDSYIRRILHVYLTICNSFQSQPNGRIQLDNLGDSEAERTVTEVLAVGISSYLMCAAFECTLANVKRIHSTSASKTSDFLISTQTERVIFESKGRNTAGKHLECARDIMAKKAAHHGAANYQYGVISFLPRRRSSEGTLIDIIDPPVNEEVRPDPQNVRLANAVSHYSYMCRLAGLNYYADQLERRLEEYRATNIFRDAPFAAARLRIDRDALEKGLFRIEGPEERRNTPKFAITGDLEHAISRFDIHRLLDFDGQDRVEEGISYATDGTALYF